MRTRASVRECLNEAGINTSPPAAIRCIPKLRFEDAAEMQVSRLSPSLNDFCAHARRAASGSTITKQRDETLKINFRPVSRNVTHGNTGWNVNEGLPVTTPRTQ